MALKKCLYCGESISEAAKICPKSNCMKSSPFDQSIKRNQDEIKKMKDERQGERQDLQQRMESALNSKIKCKECNRPINVSEVLSRKPCSECGFPDNKLKCQACGEIATVYDARNQVYSCKHHLVEVCSQCGRLVSGTEKKLHSWRIPHGGGSGSNLYCWNCYAVAFPSNTNKPTKYGCLSVLAGIFLAVLFLTFLIMV